ncbi:unnamed protein product, partial [Brassica rapa subsp. trilocularis]
EQAAIVEIRSQRSSECLMYHRSQKPEAPSKRTRANRSQSQPTTVRKVRRWKRSNYG